MVTGLPFDAQPTLRGTCVELRPLRADDFAALYTAARDPLIWTQHPAHDRWQEDVFRMFFDAGLASGGALLALDAANGAVIGSSRYDSLDTAASEVEIGWTFLARSYWGGAYNREMKRLMLTHAFRFVDAVVFRIGPANMRSRRAVEKIGGVLVDRPAAADESPRVVYRITATAFASGPLSGGHASP